MMSDINVLISHLTECSDQSGHDWIMTFTKNEFHPRSRMNGKAVQIRTFCYEFAPINNKNQNYRCGLIFFIFTTSIAQYRVLHGLLENTVSLIITEFFVSAIRDCNHPNLLRSIPPIQSSGLIQAVFPCAARFRRPLLPWRFATQSKRSWMEGLGGGSSAGTAGGSS